MAKRKKKQSSRGLAPCSYAITAGTLGGSRAFVGTGGTTLKQARTKAERISRENGSRHYVECSRYPTRGSRRRTQKKTLLVCQSGKCSKWR